MQFLPVSLDFELSHQHASCAPWWGYFLWPRNNRYQITVSQRGGGDNLTSLMQAIKSVTIDAMRAYWSVNQKNDIKLLVFN